MAYVLRASGHDVSYELDGLEGLERAKSGNYDIVLADILMPGLDGYEFAHRFKADATLAATPLVAVTALAMTGDRERIMASGFDGYISKPIEPQQFAQQVESFLARDKHGESSHH